MDEQQLAAVLERDPLVRRRGGAGCARGLRSPSASRVGSHAVEARSRSWSLCAVQRLRGRASPPRGPSGLASSPRSAANRGAATSPAAPDPERRRRPRRGSCESYGAPPSRERPRGRRGDRGCPKCRAAAWVGGAERIARSHAGVDAVPGVCCSCGSAYPGVEASGTAERPTPGGPARPARGADARGRVHELQRRSRAAEHRGGRARAGSRAVCTAHRGHRALRPDVAGGAHAVARAGRGRRDLRAAVRARAARHARERHARAHRRCGPARGRSTPGRSGRRRGARGDDGRSGRICRRRDASGRARAARALRVRSGGPCARGVAVVRGTTRPRSSSQAWPTRAPRRGAPRSWRGATIALLGTVHLIAVPYHDHGLDPGLRAGALPLGDPPGAPAVVAALGSAASARCPWGRWRSSRWEPSCDA